MTYYEEEPWGPERADLQAAQICAMISASSGVKAEAKDFMPRYGHQPLKPALTDDELQEKLHLTMMGLGGVMKT